MLDLNFPLLRLITGVLIMFMFKLPLDVPISDTNLDCPFFILCNDIRCTMLLIAHDIQFHDTLMYTQSFNKINTCIYMYHAKRKIGNC